jgi:hypothetical protein
MGTTVKKAKQAAAATKCRNSSGSSGLWSSFSGAFMGSPTYEFPSAVAKAPGSSHH